MEKNLCSGVEKLSFEDLNTLAVAMEHYVHTFRRDSMTFSILRKQQEKLLGIIRANQRDND